jgi:transcriptional regulator with XRE-family HTH domain
VTRKSADKTFDEYLLELGARIRRLRNERELSTEEAAHLAGISSGYWGLIERSAKKPSLKSLFEVAAALGVSVVDLLGVGAATTTAETPGTRTVRWIEGVVAKADPEQIEAIKVCCRAILRIRPLRTRSRAKSGSK